MQSRFFRASLQLALFLFSTSLATQSFLSTQGQAIVNESGDSIILRGMGLGGWMLQEGYMLQTASFANAQYQIRERISDLIGTAATEEFYEAWLDNHVRKIDIDSLKSWGFNSVRLPMNFALYTLPIEEEPVPGQHTWLDRGFALTDSLIAWCKANEMYVILDLHAAPGGQGQDQGISNYDPTKPSLWESQANRDKTVALWKKLAERYVNEPWVAGYDLINEPNWPLDGNILLRDLYYEITDSIRTIDQQHIIFIEGNWFANDFTNLTPPWDDQLVYSPHKYWSFNDQASIQWVLDIRATHNVPLYLGEAGENSNVWFRDAIRLLEDNQIGWAWWPMKKIESISGPLSVEKSAAYQALLDYWSGNGPAPSPSVATATLMQLTDELKMENCRYQPDVTDAMFRQVYADDAIPYRTQAIPGIVYATDYDMGTDGIAYRDNDLATYHVSTGNYTAWNRGWAYRNDGVDIETSTNLINSNGFNVGFVADGEWMQYDVAVAEDGVYNVEVRVATEVDGGSFHFALGDAAISPVVSVPNTSGWQNWQTVIVQDLVLTTDDRKLRFYIDEAEYNLASFRFTRQGDTESLTTNFLSAITTDNQHVALSLNKPLSGPLPDGTANFSLRVDGDPVTITDVTLDPDNPRVIHFGVDYTFRSGENIRISYNGTEIMAEDGTPLAVFTQRPVTNTIAIIHAVPGRVEAEDYFFQVGIQLENTTDVGGGQNIGFLDVGDYLDYYIDVSNAGLYAVDYRTAALSETGQVQMFLVGEDGSETNLHTASFPSTGGWQSWTTTSVTAILPAGRQQIRVRITQPLFNMNWFEFSFLTNTESPELFRQFSVAPNPSAGRFLLMGDLIVPTDLRLEVSSVSGKVLFEQDLNNVNLLRQELDLSALPDGIYFLNATAPTGESYTHRLVKTSH